MHVLAERILLASVTLCCLYGLSQTAPETKIRGWLSDEQCASGRAQDGIFTGTNPTCAKECVAKGKKLVLVDPQRKMILAVTNQSRAIQNIGDYVEVSGEEDSAAKTLHITRLKLLERGSASCERPKLKQ